MDHRTELSQFLRTRRARLSPADVGLPRYGRRRVPGLRREELAQLAGVSVAYYTRLEQGHAQNVSGEVLGAICDALRLDQAERDHLRNLVRPVRKRRRSAQQRVRPALQQLIDAMESTPAIVLGRRLDILGWNRLACALLGDFPAMEPGRRNLARQVFLEPAAREFYVDWTAKATEIVALLRLDAGRHPDDEALCALVEELSGRSEVFSRLWADRDVRDLGYGRKQLRHPVVGPLTLAYETMHLPDPDQKVIAYHAEPGSPSSESLNLLATSTLVPAG
ncbi:transcriptional regulator with XRE-family HTH domain [Saccharopolyspora erythraea NRRL 2338]|uniref:Transcriptional regulator, XRE family n=2 Tax=Saccharopolyspora erythraea TaxID=1836 RepID=A4FAT1_SACEN|nr:helix-turn-helix transcriptional regulator [Saccharopolyspora erythraea]EQD81973.1 XRE family transcriptional regulator [Saccharopolyspora erythraea D]PFG94938.1 transcriptional regulator with XRE-family HTH domain [Saccharopolyspora erythraea NRRL 2338]QRK91633.1 helix-turn-helix domain-containing protein [Saccharopolyspora erythraea]CAM01156.1 transcriptional regulator, XRE family [Saccharopolyspora erythraea NRRL 2338]